MRRFFYFPPWAMVTFVLGVVISPIHFWMESIACGSNSSSAHYRSSYLLNLWTSERWYPSVEEADEEFQKHLLESVEVIQRLPKFDQNGQQVGEKAVVIYAGDNHTKEYAVLWTERTNLRTVRASSLRHVLQFEKNAGH